MSLDSTCHFLSMFVPLYLSDTSKFVCKEVSCLLAFLCSKTTLIIKFKQNKKKKENSLPPSLLTQSNTRYRKWEVGERGHKSTNRYRDRYFYPIFVCENTHCGGMERNGEVQESGHRNSNRYRDRYFYTISVSENTHRDRCFYPISVRENTNRGGMEGEDGCSAILVPQADAPVSATTQKNVRHKGGPFDAVDRRLQEIQFSSPWVSEVMITHVLRIVHLNQSGLFETLKTILHDHFELSKTLVSQGSDKSILLLSLC